MMLPCSVGITIDHHGGQYHPQNLTGIKRTPSPAELSTLKGVNTHTTRCSHCGSLFSTTLVHGELCKFGASLMKRTSVYLFWKHGRIYSLSDFTSSKRLVEVEIPKSFPIVKRVMQLFWQTAASVMHCSRRHFSTHRPVNDGMDDILGKFCDLSLAPPHGTSKNSRPRRRHAGRHCGPVHSLCVMEADFLDRINREPPMSSCLDSWIPSDEDDHAFVPRTQWGVPSTVNLAMLENNIDQGQKWFSAMEPMLHAEFNVDLDGLWPSNIDVASDLYKSESAAFPSDHSDGPRISRSRDTTSDVGTTSDFAGVGRQPPVSDVRLPHVCDVCGRNYRIPSELK